MNTIFYIALLLFLKNCHNTENCYNTEKYSLNKEETIDQTINNILRLGKENNIDILNEKYIHDVVGIYERKRIGAIDRFFHYKKINKERSAVGTIYQVITTIDGNDISQNPIYYDSIRYNCNSYEWDKNGLFISKTIDIEAFKNLLVEKSHSEAELENMKLIYKNSYKVVLTNKDLVFYLMNLNEKFYIVLIDRVVTDCGS